MCDTKKSHRKIGAFLVFRRQLLIFCNITLANNFIVGANSSNSAKSSQDAKQREEQNNSTLEKSSVDEGMNKICKHMVMNSTDRTC